MKCYDITERIKKRNQLPKVKIFEKEFEVRAKMTNFLVVMHEAKELQKIEGNDADAMLDKIYGVISHSLGNKAVEYLKELDITTEATLDVMVSCILMINGSDLDDDDEVGAEKK